MALVGRALPTTINVVYKDELCSKTYSRLVMEAIKYLLYERHQIPFPYEQMRRSLQEETHTNRDLASENNVRCKLTVTKSSRIEAKKRQLVENVEELFSNLEVLFQSTRVFSVCVMFGPTQVSSKESFTFHFSNFLSNDCDMGCTDKTTGVLCRKMIRNLVANEELASMKEISPTSMFVAVLSHKETSVDWFLPKRTFKPPHRGHLYNIGILASSGQNDLTDMTSEHFQRDDLLWFQAPVAIKGLKET